MLTEVPICRGEEIHVHSFSRAQSCSAAVPEAPAGLERGYFVSPTVFSEVAAQMTIAQEEIFGPVLAIQPYEDAEDALRIANESSYGLAGGVWSADQERAIAVARRMGPARSRSTVAPITRWRPLAATSSPGTGARTDPTRSRSC